LTAGFICQKFLALFSTFLFPFWIQFMIWCTKEFIDCEFRENQCRESTLYFGA
jgi:hypothetical protein